jgi:hypothetical protein
MSMLPAEDPGVHVMRHPDEEITVIVVQRARHSAVFTNAGSTEHFVVAYQHALGHAGVTLANGVLRSCEKDYAQVQSWFGDVVPSREPLTCLIVRGQFGAFHVGCSGTEIHASAFSGHNVDLVELVTMAEVVEVFAAAQNSGWDCGASNGEGLSRVLATDLYPEQLDGFATAAAWLDSHRPNFVDHNDGTDQNPVSTGCAVLFLHYLHDQLGYTWRDIVTRGRNTLGETYRALTNSSSTGWPEFSELLATRFPPGKPSRVKGDNVFPLR